MDDAKLAAMLGNVLGTGAATAVLLLILWRVVKGIAGRWIAALDAVATGLREHTERDLQSHRELGDRVAAGQSALALQVAAGQSDVRAGLAELDKNIVRVETKLDSGLDWLAGERTPVDGIKRPASERRGRTNPQGYRPPRPGDHHDD